AVACCDPWGFDAGEQAPVPVYMLGLPDGKVRFKLDGHRAHAFAATFRPDGKRLATLGTEGTIRVWDTATGRELVVINLGKALPVPPGWELAGLNWSPDGRLLASAVGDGVVRIWDAERGEETARFAHNARCVAWSPDGTRIASGGKTDLQVRL